MPDAEAQLLTSQEKQRVLQAVREAEDALRRAMMTGNPHQLSQALHRCVEQAAQLPRHAAAVAQQVCSTESSLISMHGEENELLTCLHELQQQAATLALVAENVTPSRAEETELAWRIEWAHAQRQAVDELRRRSLAQEPCVEAWYCQAQAEARCFSVEARPRAFAFSINTHGYTLRLCVAADAVTADVALGLVTEAGRQLMLLQQPLSTWLDAIDSVVAGW